MARALSGLSRRGTRVPRRGRLMACLLAMGLVATACSGTGQGAGDTRTLRFQEIYAPGNAFADATQTYGDAVTEASDGSLGFEFHWSNSVVATDEVAGAMRDGLLDLARLQPPASPAEFPVTNWLASAANRNVDSFPGGLLQQIGAHLEFAMNSPELAAELERLGIRYIAPLALVQRYDLLCRDRVDSLDDIAGTPVRVAGEAWVNEADNLGAQPITLLPEEIYEGYQRGVVDCVMTYPTHYVDSGLWELGGYHVPVSLTGWNQDAIAISAATWEELDAADRRALFEQVRVWVETFVRQQLSKHWQFVTDAPKHGVELLEPNQEIQAKIDAHHARVETTMIANAPDKVDDPAAVLDRYDESHQKWRGIIDELGFDTAEQSLRAWVDDLQRAGKTPDDIDLGPWLDRITREVYAPLVREAA